MPRKELSIISLIGLWLITISGLAQTPVSGVINAYGKVVSIDGTDRVSLADASAFAAGDTVMIVQMKGVGINVNNNIGSFGSMQNKYSTGHYELLIVLSVSGNQIVFTADLSKTYEIEGNIQLVKARGYNNAVVTGELTCQPWDSATGTGGVLAILVGNTLDLQASINVSGKGFRGGVVVNGNGECSETDTGYLDMSFMYSSDSAGFKGEGLASYNLSLGNPLDTFYSKGRGPLFNGGGGGNALHSGGGGGANYGTGGSGGNESNVCGTPGSVGGWYSYSSSNISGWSTDNRIFMGGAGGSGTQSGGDLGTPGGNGGGIVLIMADTLIGNGFGIFANGESVSGIASAGAGGGGAGGTILLDVAELKSTVSVEVKGGTGGITNGPGCTGPGGGGGGGIIWHSNPINWGNATTDISGGAKGVSLNGSCASYVGADGGDGIILASLSVPLTGFLFNSVVSSVSGDITDTICEGEVVPKLLGSIPKGGTGPYTFTWESSNDKSTWTVETSGVAERNLDLGVQLFDTTYYRRTITDNSVPVIIDVSKVLTIVVQPRIQQNQFSFDTTICFGQTPNPILPVFGIPAGGDGTYAYLWEESTDGINFTDAAGINTNDIYQPPALNDTMYYRRNVYSGKCQNISDTVTINVLPLVGNNAVSADQTICQGFAFVPLSGTVPSGGDNSYIFQWVESTDYATWNNAYGTNANQNYSPDTTSTTFPGTTYFRRVVYSGLANTCSDTSNAVTLIDWPKITSNFISGDQQICEGEVPLPFVGNAPGGGNGTYTYLWEQSNDNAAFIAGTETNTNINYSAAALIDTTYYRRVVYSDVCRDTSLVLTITVDPLIQNYGINLPSGLRDTTICENQAPAAIIQEPAPIVGGDGIYTYAWEKSTDAGTTWTGTGGNTVSYAPGNLIQTTLYRRGVTSGACQVTSDTVAINVLPAISGNTLPADFSICFGDSSLLDGSLPAGGEAGVYSYLWEESPDALSWSSAGGSNLQEDYQTPVLTSQTFYRRIVSSGPASTCRDTSTDLRINILPLPTAVIAGLDTAICDGDAVGLTFQVSGVTGPWNLTYDDGFGNPAVIGIANTSPQVENITPSTTAAFTDFQYTITDVTDNAGCKALPADLTGLAKVHVDGIPVTNAGPDEEVCGFTYTLKATNPAFGSSSWLVPAGMTLSDTMAANAQATVTSEGNYPLTWQVSNGVCPLQTAVVTITFWQDPGNVHAGNDTVLEPGQTIIDLSGSQDSPVIGMIQWTTNGNAVINTPSAFTTNVTNLDPGENLFILSVTNGACPVKTDDVIVTVQKFNQHNYGISPNGDGINDFFRVTGAENVENTLTIFDGNGVVVYKIDNFMHTSNESSSGWGGTANDLSPLPEGTYYFILKIRGKVQETLSGYIVVKRQ
ncbi:MAG: gliding motility-associated C-terminal domain-containing protein [Chlorobi bacterium]|nr:gliding motility-associated C-terminal domain-containing protein [Chlorobiota bacterium]